MLAGIQTLISYVFITFVILIASVLTPSIKMATRLRQICVQFYVLYVVTAHIEQLADCLGIIGFPAQPFEQYIPGEDNSSAAYRHVVAEPLKFAAQAQ